MKSKKLLPAKILMGASYLSMLTASCVPQDYLANAKENQADSDSHVVLPISSYKDIHGINVQSYMMFAHDIFTDSTLCQRINENPKIVDEHYGFSLDELDSQEREMLFALGDAEVQAALEAQDFKAYLGILEKKNILQSNTIKIINEYFSTTKSSEASESDLPTDEISQEFNPFVIVPLVFYAVVAVVAAIAIDLALFTHLGVKFQGDGKKDVTKSSCNEDAALYVFYRKLMQEKSKTMNYGSSHVIEAQSMYDAAVNLMMKKPEEVNGIAKTVIGRLNETDN